MTLQVNFKIKFLVSGRKTLAARSNGQSFLHKQTKTLPMQVVQYSYNVES